MSDIKGLCTVIGCFVSHVGITSKPLTSFTLYVLLQNCAEKFVQVLCYIFLIMTVLYSRNIFELHWDLFWWCLSCYILSCALMWSLHLVSLRYFAQVVLCVKPIGWSNYFSCYFFTGLPKLLFFASKAIFQFLQLFFVLLHCGSQCTHFLVQVIKGN